VQHGLISTRHRLNSKHLLLAQRQAEINFFIGLTWGFHIGQIWDMARCGFLID
jgi:hypothetical protein